LWFAALAILINKPLYMKARGFLVLVGSIALFAFSCKKDIKPLVVYTVVDTTGAVLEMAHVYTHPCFDGVSCDTSRINENFIKDGLTNSAGQISYEYPYSAIIDVYAEYFPCDTASGLWCPFTGRTVARFETKRTSGDEENIFHVRVVVRKQTTP